ncbi:hypothetical protein D6R50_24280 [Aeromonas veronii]|uniref:Uncharacterized protein n=1 Tax=Aeromonas veronii TaxID=654 RepID=A0A3A9I2C3_AERVE|nr:hypothetical protein D6R50_24280 [Aeromonas veronii]
MHKIRKTAEAGKAGGQKQAVAAVLNAPAASGAQAVNDVDAITYWELDAAYGGGSNLSLTLVPPIQGTNYIRYTADVKSGLGEHIKTAVNRLRLLDAERFRKVLAWDGCEGMTGRWYAEGSVVARLRRSTGNYVTASDRNGPELPETGIVESGLIPGAGTSPDRAEADYEIRMCRRLTVTKAPSSVQAFTLQLVADQGYDYGGPVPGYTWVNYRYSRGTFHYRQVAPPLPILVSPAVVECGYIAGREARNCNNSFRVTRVDGGALPRGRLAFSVGPDAMTGNPTVAKMGGAGTMQVVANGIPVPLDGTAWAGDVTSNTSFVPRITGTGTEMGEKKLNITATFTAD